MKRITNITELANIFGVHRNTMKRWIAKYEAQGRTLDMNDLMSVHKFIEYRKIRLPDQYQTKL